MFFIALKNLFQEKTKLAISIGGVAFAVLLIILINGLYQGWSKQMGSYIENIPADIWVAQEGSSDMFHSVSFVPSNVRQSLENIDGIKNVEELYGRAFAFKLNGEEKSLYILGLDPSTGFGKPNGMREGGWNDLQLGEIIVDESFAKKNHLEIGDILNIDNEPLTISGISTGGNMLVYQYGFVTREQAMSLFQQEDSVNYYAVTLSGVNEPDRIKKNIDRVPGIKSMSKAEFVDHNQKIINDSFLPIILVLDVIGLLIGIAVIGLTIYSATIDKAREYGVMKAIGLSNNQLFKITIWQSLTSGIIGLIVGTLFSFAVAKAAKIIVPDFITIIRPVDLLLAALATLGMSLLASYVPIRRISLIDPAEVFKS